MAAAVTPSRGGVSPSSSPRLPSPPPMPELQFGPQSPLTGATMSESQDEANNKQDESARRRIRPGTKAADMAKGPPLVPLNQVDSAFPLQEHLKALYAHSTHGQYATHTTPITKDTARQIARPPQYEDGESADRNLWLYEICRFLTTKAGLVSCALMEDSPPCSSLTCPEMRASEWQYLCAVHEPPKSCCAIDYVNHTLDWAANVLTSTKHFPSRLQLGGGESGSAYQSMRQLTNIFRRVYRIFAHAWFQHREVFWHIESTHGIYILFKTVCDEYQLIPDDNYTIPPEAEGPREEAESPAHPTPTEANPSQASMQILRKDTTVAPSQNGTDPTASSPPQEPTPAQTARRHRHTPSTGSHVTTIAEGTEEEEEVPPVPPIPHSGPSDEPTTAIPPDSPQRSAREALGRLNLSSPDSKFPATSADDSAKLAQPEHPTPTTSHVQDPLAAAGAATKSTSPATSGEKKSDSTPAPAPVKLDTSSATEPKPISEQDRRGSNFESEVRSPGGGSIRTAGPDLLGAILGHMDDKEREEVLAAKEVVQGKAEEKDAHEEDADGDGEETMLFIGEDAQKDAGPGEKEKATTKTPEGADKSKGAEKENDSDDGGDDDEDEAETMEEIKLPSRDKQDAEKEKENDGEK
ncbi:uncharacterized protein HMPREF1541_01815 [Cyphellophora europaea CBS 101466]|uniref:Mob1/phocein n=1 Tax=Cyphellophora europaea (strain CBS 101466) TaxID=1220924 RepID=W2S3N8_CYPE1|nr:uncharacterized protein HMPREF1541_01815 [Cyphellophora europaea CBS 101466]ETN42658.1 hypothetical protein HMPREF1541_01815 [Cyphellophora europaea CBS 101466]